MKLDLSDTLMIVGALLMVMGVGLFNIAGGIFLAGVLLCVGVLARR